MASGISSRFQLLSQRSGQVPHVLRTRSPLGLPEQAPWTSFDLHVLSTPPAFILSQDQTLQQKRGQLSDAPKCEFRAGNDSQRALRPSRERLMWTKRPCCRPPRGTNPEATVVTMVAATRVGDSRN